MEINCGDVIIFLRFYWLLKKKLTSQEQISKKSSSDTKTLLYLSSWHEIKDEVLVGVGSVFGVCAYLEFFRCCQHGPCGNFVPLKPGSLPDLLFNFHLREIPCEHH